MAYLQRYPQTYSIPVTLLRFPFTANIGLLCPYCSIHYLPTPKFVAAGLAPSLCITQHYNKIIYYCRNMCHSIKIRQTSSYMFSLLTQNLALLQYRALRQSQKDFKDCAEFTLELKTQPFWSLFMANKNDHHKSFLTPFRSCNRRGYKV